MITIDDYDFPVTVAEKLIRGTRPYNPTSFQKALKALAKAVSGNEEAGDFEDMFTIEELKEIADYLLVYYEAHKGGD